MKAEQGTCEVCGGVDYVVSIGIDAICHRCAGKVREAIEDARLAEGVAYHLACEQEGEMSVTEFRNRRAKR